MAKNKPPKISVPEMETLLEGMQELLTDEDGNPLPPDHPQYQKFSNLAEQINKIMLAQDSSSCGPEGHA